jgi:hypothetical protein
MTVRTKQELRDRLNALKEQEKKYMGIGMPDTSNRMIIRAQMKGILFALNEDEGFRVVE